MPKNSSHLRQKALSVDVMRRDILMSHSAVDNEVDDQIDRVDHNHPGRTDPPDTADPPDRADHPNTADPFDRADPTNTVDHNDADHVDRIDATDSVDTADPVSVNHVEDDSERGADLPQGGREMVHVSNSVLRETDTEVKYPPSDGEREKHEDTDHQHESSKPGECHTHTHTHAHTIVTFPRQSSMSPNVIYLLDVNPSNSLPQPLSSPPIPLRVIQLQRFGC